MQGDGPRAYELIEEAYNGWRFASGCGGEELIAHRGDRERDSLPAEYRRSVLLEILERRGDIGGAGAEQNSLAQESFFGEVERMAAHSGMNPGVRAAVADADDRLGRNLDG